MNPLQSIFRRIFVPAAPCYRCGKKLAGHEQKDLAGYHYCITCRDVVSIMMAAVSHDPPFGFPGAKGYLEIPGRPI